MAEIVVKVQKDGNTVVSVNGVAGPGCRNLSAAIEKALGQETSVEFTAEYYQEAQTEQQVGQQ